MYQQEIKLIEKVKTIKERVLADHQAPYTKEKVQETIKNHFPNTPGSYAIVVWSKLMFE